MPKASGKSVVKKAESNGAVNRLPAQEVRITAPRLLEASFKIRGTTPYVQHKFSQKAKEQMKAKQEQGTTVKSSKKRDAKNFQECYEQSMYISEEGWNGIPATQFKAAMVAACRLVNFKMTESKQAVWVECDGYDRYEPTGLIRFTKGKPEYFEQAVRNETGVADIRARGMWKPGWEAVVRIKYDADQITLEEVANLLLRAGLQVGIGEGRMASRKCVGLGWGAFTIVGSE